MPQNVSPGSAAVDDAARRATPTAPSQQPNVGVRESEHVSDLVGSRTVRSEYLERTLAWRRFHQQHLPRAELISVSWHDGERRVFRDGAEIIKVYRHTPAARLKLGAGLTREHEIACFLASRVRAHVAASTHASIDEHWEVMRIPVIDGETVDELLASGRARHVSLVRALATIVRTNLAGVAHGDISIGNVIVSPSGRANLLDWGRAVRAPRLKALAGDVLGVGPNRTGSAFRNLVRTVLLARQASTGPIARIYARRWNKRVGRGERRSVVKHKGWIDREITGLLELGSVWELGAGDLSNAAEAEPWGFELVGLHGNGRRGWETTWERIRPRLSWAGRQVVDLGPDAGFTATFARMEGAGSSHVLASDGHRAASAEALAACFEVDGVSTRVAKAYEPAVATELRSGGDLVVALGQGTAQWLDTVAHLFVTSDAHELLVEVPVARARALTAQWEHHGRRVSEIAVPDDSTVILHARWRVGV